MAFEVQDLPASSQLSSVLSDPPLSDNEILGEITVTVDLNGTATSQNQDSLTHKTKEMPSKISESGSQIKRQSQRQPKRKPLYRANSSEDELGGEIQVSTSVSKTAVPAKRNRSNSTTKTTPKPAAKKTKPASVRGSKKWEPEYVTQNTKSPLVTNGVDLRTLLLQPAAWDVLSADDKREILSFFPADVHILDPNTPDARPNVGSLSSNDTFRHDAEEYVSNIARGMHDPEWLQQAWAAHQRRAGGDFDEFYIRKVEVDWNTDIPNEHRPEHLRIVERSASNSPGSQETVTMEGAPRLGRSAEHLGENGASENGTGKQNDPARDLSVQSTNGNEAHTPNLKIPNGTSGVADSITARSEEPSKSNDGPRFEVIPSPDESEVDQAPDPKATLNGTLNGFTQEMSVGTEVNVGGNNSEIEALGGEITVAEEAMELDDMTADDQKE